MQVSRRDALRYASTVSALAGLGAASAVRQAPAAAAAAPTLIDYAMRQIPAQDIRAAEHSGVINYVSTSRPGSSFGAKPITLPYAQSLVNAGLVIVSNFQYGKPRGTAPSDFTRGFAGGVADAKTAWSLHTAAGGNVLPGLLTTHDCSAATDLQHYPANPRLQVISNASWDLSKHADPPYMSPRGQRRRMLFPLTMGATGRTDHGQPHVSDYRYNEAFSVHPAP